MNWDAVSHLISLFIGMAGGWIGAWLGMKVGIVKLEIWKDAAQQSLKEVASEIPLIREDLLVHDIEIGDLMARSNLARVRRQRMRD